LNSEIKAELIANAFKDGYLTAGGNSKIVENAGLTKYTRVFSIFALPSILRNVNLLHKPSQEKTRRPQSSCQASDKTSQITIG
jgi:hypothetical protein